MEKIESAQTKMTKVSGGCLCGAITYTSTTNGKVGVCHCSMCRRWSGGPAFALEHSADLHVTGDEHLTVYKSSDWGERCFCKTCGTNLFWRSPTYNHVSIMAGTLTDDAALTFTNQIFIDNKPGYYDFANETKNMTEAEVIAMFTANDGNTNSESSNG